MKSGILKKAVFVVALSLVGTQVQAGYAPNWLNWDSAKSKLNDASTFVYQYAGDVIGGLKSGGTSLCSTVSEQGSSLYSRFDALDTQYKALVALGVAAATGGAAYYGYKYFTQSKEDNKK